MDFNAFAKNFITAAINMGYIPSNFRQPEDAVPFYALMKQDGALLYGILLYNLEHGDENLLHCHKQAQFYTMTIQEQHHFHQAVIYHIFVVKEKTGPLCQFIDASQEYCGQSLYEINYGAVLSARSSIASNKQPHHLQYIRAMMDNAFLAQLESSPAESDLITLSRQRTELPPKTKHAYAAAIIMVLNILCFLLLTFTGGSTNILNLLRFGAMQYDLFIHGEWYRVLTAAFLHSGLMHLAGNTLSLYIFGFRVEKYYGTLSFLTIYFCAAIAGNLANAYFLPQGVLVGASGGIFGLIGAALAVTQLTRKQLEGMTFYTICLMIAYNLVYGFTNPRVGNVAHIGGLIAGYAIGFLLSKLSIAKRR